MKSKQTELLTELGTLLKAQRSKLSSKRSVDLLMSHHHKGQQLVLLIQKSFGEEVCQLVHCRHPLYFNAAVIYLLAHIEVANIKVFRFLMVAWSVSKGDRASVISKKLSRNILG